jgi:hypothetical protein
VQHPERILLFNSLEVKMRTEHKLLPVQHTLSIQFTPEHGDEQIVPVQAKLEVNCLDHTPRAISGRFIDSNEDQVVQFELDLADAKVWYRGKKYAFERLDRAGTFSLRQGWIAE